MNFPRKLMALAATLALTAGAAFSAPAEDSHAGRGQARLMRAHGRQTAKALNLSDVQKEQAKAIRQKHRSENEGLRTELKNLNGQLRAAREARNTAEAQRLAALREPLVLRAREAWQAERAELKGVLTPEQQAKLDEMQKARESRRQQRRG